MPTLPKRIFDFFSSLRLTVVCLTLALVLVFIGTMAQVEQGLYQAQARYFKSFFIWWAPGGSGFKLPIFPGGYLVGSVLLVNLIAAHFKRFELSRKKFGIFIIHGGLILLLLGQLFTDVLSVESAMQLSEGESKNYSEDFHANELVLIDGSDANHDRVVSIPEKMIASQKEVPVPGTPFTVRVKDYWINADLMREATEGAKPAGATEGIGKDLFVRPRPATTKMDERNLPAALVEVAAGGKALGTWLVSPNLGRKQTVTHENKEYDLAFRFTRHYMPFQLTLLDARHDVYTGTDIPKNFSSSVKIQNARSGENRDVLIYMNNPLRYGGLTFFQFQMGADRAGGEASTLQVVRNPSWLTPYISCALVGLGLLVQFLSHLFAFVRRRAV